VATPDPTLTLPAPTPVPPLAVSFSTQISGQRLTLPVAPVPLKELAEKSSRILRVPVAVPCGKEICAHVFPGLVDEQVVASQNSTIGGEVSLRVRRRNLVVVPVEVSVGPGVEVAKTVAGRPPDVQA
jgi:hypothetical protein